MEDFLHICPKAEWHKGHLTGQYGLWAAMDTAQYTLWAVMDMAQYTLCAVMNTLQDRKAMV